MIDFKQIVKFGIVGAIAFFIDYLVLVILTDIFGVYYLLSSFIAYILAFLFNFFASMRFVFSGKKGQTKRIQFIIFCLISIIAAALNQAFMSAFVEILKWDYRLAQIVVAGLVMIWNYMSRKNFLDEKEVEDGHIEQF